MQFSELRRTYDPSSIRTVLLLPFEDQEILKLAAREFPRATQHVIRKEDLAGLSPSRVIARVRRVRADLVLASLGDSAVRRSRAAMELLIGLSRARHRILRTGQDDLALISRAGLMVRILPSFLTALVLGLGSAAWTYWLVFYYGSRFRGDNAGSRRAKWREEPNKVLFIRCDLAGSVQAGGSATHITGMVNAFRRAGLHVVYLADQRLESLPSDVEQISIKPISTLGVFDEFQLLAFNLQLLRRLPQVISDTRPRIIYQRHAVLSFAAAIAARKASLPLVLEVNASEVWVKRHWSRLTFDRLAERCERLAFQLADLLAVISEPVREQLARFQIPAQKFLLTPNGVDPEIFSPDVDGRRVRARLGWDGEIVVGFIGTFTRWHGVETLFDAAVIALRQNPNLRFLLIGEGDLRATLEARAAESGVGEKFTFAGKIPHALAPEYLAACDVLLSPHLGFEDGTRFFGSPTKLFEYMAMGKAVIASRLEQIGKVIVDGVNGLQMNPGDAAQLAGLILKLADDRELRRRLGAQARRDAVARYTWDRNVESIMKAIRV